MAISNPAVILYDANGVALSVADAVSIPASTPGILILGDESGTARYINVIDDVGIKRLAVDVAGIASIVGSVSTSPVLIPSDPAKIIKEELKLTGSPDMLVDGTSPKDFRFPADATDDIKLSELRIVLGATNIHFDGTKFGAISTLTNGIQLSIRAQSITTVVDVIQDNMDLVALVSPTTTFFNDTGPSSVLAVGLSFGGQIVLDGGSADYVELKVQDDLTGPSFNHLQATIWTVKN